MMRLHYSMIIILGLALNTLAGSAEGQTRPTTIHVPDDVRTLQEAIDRATDGGTVELAPGTYTETADIVGKRVNVIGGGRRGSRSAVLIGARPKGSDPLPPMPIARGLINYGAGGGGRLENLALVGGDVGVLGLEDERGSPANVRIENVLMARNGRGVAGRFSGLRLARVSIIGSAGHALSLVCVRNLQLLDDFVADAGELGMLVISCDASQHVSIGNSTFSGNHGGGAAFIGDMILSITDSAFQANRNYGVLLVVVGGVTPIINTSLSGTTEGSTPLTEGWADGLIAIGPGVVSLFGCELTGNSRSGVLVNDSEEIRLFNTTAAGGRFGLVAQHNSTYILNGNANFISGTEQDILTDGDLPVPDAPAEVPPH